MSKLDPLLSVSRPLALVFAMAMLVAVAPACKTDKTRVCDRLESLMADEGGYNRTICEQQVRLYEESCGNFEAIVDCWLTAESRSDFGSCTEDCEEAELGAE